MVSIKRIEANRQNAQKSTGPKTPQGKAKSAQNAVTHGLTSQRPVLTVEDKDEFDVHANEILVWLDPQDPIETILARRVATLSWRMQRASVYETLVLDNLLNANADEETDPETHLGHILTDDFQNKQTLSKIQIYENRIERSMLRCLSTLRRIRDSKLLTYSKITDYVRGGDEQPEPFFQDANAKAKFPAHLEKRMAYRNPKKQNEPNPKSSPSFQGGVPRSGEGVLSSPAEGDSINIQSAIGNLQFQNEPNSETFSVGAGPCVCPTNEQPSASAINIQNKQLPEDNNFELYPRWSTTVLNDVGYSEKARSKMTKVEREEAADRVLCSLKDPKQYLWDRNLIFFPQKQNEPKSSPSFQGGVSRSDEGVLSSPAEGDSSTTNSELRTTNFLQNEPNPALPCHSERSEESDNLLSPQGCP